jgi:hypothetical protein
MLAQDPIILFSDVVDSLPLYYRAMAQHLADTNRIIIKGSSEESAKEA